MSRASAMLTTKHMLADTAVGVLRYPIWWYSHGLSLAFRSFGRIIVDANKFLGVGVWARNLFVPMYGEDSFSGRVISFFMRLVNIAFRGIVFLLLILAAVLALAAYLLVLPFAIYGVIYHGFGLLFA